MSDEEVNLFAQQAANRRKSVWLMLLFVAFFAWLGLGGDWIAWQLTKDLPPQAYHHLFPFGGAFLFAIGFGLVLYIRKTGASKVLWSTGATLLETPTTPEEKLLVNVVEEMAIASGIPKPKIYLVEDADPNAFATGMDPMNASIAVTTGLLLTVNREELQAVIGHEMGHVKNLDIKLMTLMAGLVGAVALISDGLGRGLRVGFGGRDSKSSKNMGPLVAVVLVLWIISWILAPIITRLMAVAISRKREYLADAMSAQFTRNPLALASALEKIEGAVAPTAAIKGGVAHLCIADPLGRKAGNMAGLVGDLFATHPPMAMRVARLKAMGYQAQKAAGNFQPS